MAGADSDRIVECLRVAEDSSLSGGLPMAALVTRTGLVESRVEDALEVLFDQGRVWIKGSDYILLSGRGGERG